MESIAAKVRADVRLAILQILARELGYSHNHEVLRAAVDVMTAISVTDDDIKAHLAWLENQGLVTTEVLGRRVKAQLTDEGLKVAQGRRVVDGVTRPQPSEI